MWGIDSLRYTKYRLFNNSSGSISTKNGDIFTVTDNLEKYDIIFFEMTTGGGNYYQVVTLGYEWIQNNSNTNTYFLSSSGTGGGIWMDLVPLQPDTKNIKVKTTNVAFLRTIMAIKLN